MSLSEGGINVTADTKVYVRENPNFRCGCGKMRREREVFSLPRCILCTLSKDSGPAVVSEIPPAGEGRKEGIPRRDTKQCLYLHMWQNFKIFLTMSLFPLYLGPLEVFWVYSLACFLQPQLLAALTSTMVIYFRRKKFKKKIHVYTK